MLVLVLLVLVLVVVAVVVAVVLVVVLVVVVAVAVVVLVLVLVLVLMLVHANHQMKFARAFYAATLVTRSRCDCGSPHFFSSNPRVTNDPPAMAMPIAKKPRLQGAELCTFYHHVTPCPECPGIGEAFSCIAKEACTRKSVCCIAALRGDNGKLFWEGMFVNAYEPGKRSRVHAEAQLVQCTSLHRAIRENPLASELRLWLTFQPCHYSGGNDRDRSSLSCTELLHEFYRQHLRPAGVRLCVQVANVYRAHWSRLAEAKTHMQCILASRSGLALLASFASVSAFTREDWEYVESLHDADVVVSPAHRTARGFLDAHIRKFLRSARTSRPLQCVSPSSV